jgi:hypothetical protein
VVSWTNVIQNRFIYRFFFFHSFVLFWGREEENKKKRTEEKNEIRIQHLNQPPNGAEVRTKKKEEIEEVSGWLLNVDDAP